VTAVTDMLSVFRLTVRKYFPTIDLTENVPAPHSPVFRDSTANVLWMLFFEGCLSGGGWTLDQLERQEET
jgi:hypothetical protein